MFRYYGKKQKSSIDSSTVSQNVNVEENNNLEINRDDVLSDPGLRKPITTFDPI
ncbi:hypothetical protein CASFOL_001972 [Castilleja foliolosa]|uniref:Uncharacterized protein n=1 Tax=Castilleja foliolosa TaxID=1961234 RepID=A0ABD3EDN1_9LAMI